MEGESGEQVGGDIISRVFCARLAESTSLLNPRDSFPSKLNHFQIASCKYARKCGFAFRDFVLRDLHKTLQVSGVKCTLAQLLKGVDSVGIRGP